MFWPRLLVNNVDFIAIYFVKKNKKVNCCFSNYLVYRTCQEILFFQNTFYNQRRNSPQYHWRHACKQTPSISYFPQCTLCIINVLTRYWILAVHNVLIHCLDPMVCEHVNYAQGALWEIGYRRRLFTSVTSMVHRSIVHPCFYNCFVTGLNPERYLFIYTPNLLLHIK